ncbi:MAG: helix-turn-helix domain-containing protein [Candidatus Methanoperedens sp.]|nr:helix-turn-helix domain-containing protein [Candidatus Methanoperedens sp.]
MSIGDKKQEILTEIKKITESKQTVRYYFEHNYVAFSREQYYRYCRILHKYGEEGLRDHRKDGNYTKLTQRIKDYVVSTVKENTGISSSQLQDKILNQFSIQISKSDLNKFRASVSLTRVPPPKEIKCEHQKSGGGEILTTLAFHTHIIDIFTNTIIERINEVRQSQQFEQNKNIEEDYPDTRSHGKFTREYNQLQSVRENRFKSIDDKIQKKNFSSMNIFGMSDKIISR